MPPNRIHHLNFVVRDLEEAMERFERILDVEPFSLVDHPPRGANVARTRVGDSWFVLVCPYEPDSVPGQHLAKHGEGFFLVSFGVDDLAGQLDSLDAQGIDLNDKSPRAGILDWEVADIGELNGALIQLTQED
jgi:methylmalonyl-CoA/ethylmalonyl-CoA epimerase